MVKVSVNQVCLKLTFDTHIILSIKSRITILSTKHNKQLMAKSKLITKLTAQSNSKNYFISCFISCITF